MIDDLDRKNEDDWQYIDDQSDLWCRYLDKMKVVATRDFRLVRKKDGHTIKIKQTQRLQDVEIDNKKGVSRMIAKIDAFVEHEEHVNKFLLFDDQPCKDE